MENFNSNLAKATSFVCLLHLANEKGLKLVQNDEERKNSDFRIEVPH